MNISVKKRGDHGLPIATQDITRKTTESKLMGKHQLKTKLLRYVIIMLSYAENQSK